MEHLIQNVSEMCNFKTQGGRVHVLSDMKTCYIFDVSQIDHKTLTYLHNRANIQVIGECTSLSGYVIRVQLKPNLLTKVMTVMILVGGMCAVNYYILYNNVLHKI